MRQFIVKSAVEVITVCIEKELKEGVNMKDKLPYQEPVLDVYEFDGDIINTSDGVINSGADGGFEDDLINLQ